MPIEQRHISVSYFLYSKIDEAKQELGIYPYIARTSYNAQNYRITEQEESKRICQTIATDLKYKIHDDMAPIIERYDTTLDKLKIIVLSRFCEIIKDLGSYQHVYDMCAYVFHGLKDKENACILNSIYEMISGEHNSTSLGLPKTIDTIKMRAAIKYTKDHVGQINTIKDYHPALTEAHINFDHLAAYTFILNNSNNDDANNHKKFKNYDSDKRQLLRDYGNDVTKIEVYEVHEYEHLADMGNCCGMNFECSVF